MADTDDGDAFTVTADVVATNVPQGTVALTVYTPPLDEVVVRVGFCEVEVKPFGPDQE